MLNRDDSLGDMIKHHNNETSIIYSIKLEKGIDFIKIIKCKIRNNGVMSSSIHLKSIK